jgi:hypothetical protein
MKGANFNGKNRKKREKCKCIGRSEKAPPIFLLFFI